MALLQGSKSIGNRLVDELVKQGKIEPDLGAALKARYKSVHEIVDFLLSKEKVEEEDLVKASSVVYNLPFVHLQGRSISSSILTIIPENLAKSFSAIAYELNGHILKVAVGRPYFLSPKPSGPLHEIEKQKGIKIVLAVTTVADVDWAMQGYAKTSNSADTKLEIPAHPSFQSVDLKSVPLVEAILAKFPIEIVDKYKMIVFGQTGNNQLKVAALDPGSQEVGDLIKFVEQKNNVKIDLFKTNLEGFDFARARLTAIIGNKTPLAPQTAAKSEPALPKVEVKPVPVVQPIAVNTSPLKPITPAPVAPPSAAIVGVSTATKIQELPSGQSPEQGSVTSDGVIIIGSKEVAAVSAAPTAATEGDLDERNLDKFLGSMIKTTDELVAVIKSGFIPKSVAAILAYGIFLKASDIHLEPVKNYFRLRYRVDGILSEYAYMPLTLHPALISRIKILSNLKIDEQRIPQDGRYDATANNHEFDVRVSTLPTVHGEKVVMRLLDKTTSALSFEDLGITGTSLERLKEQLAKPWGVVMSTGPTGSGKSTTLYAILNIIANPKVNVITLEDPVEYEMKGINQVQVKPKIGFSFAEGLRSVLRQDPNIIMVGEIRDSETAELTTHAALTGHLVLTTLHTNNSAGALPRLINMGVEPFLITSAINAVISQRLVRKLCQKCRQPVTVPDTIKEKVKEILADAKEVSLPPELNFYGPKGCDECRTGFTGRLGIYEVLCMSDKIEQVAVKEAPASEIEAIARQEGMITMIQDGMIKALKGLTTVDEVLKVTSDK